MVSIHELSITVHLCGVLQKTPSPGRPWGEAAAGAHPAPGRCVSVPAACSSPGHMVGFALLLRTLETFYSFPKVWSLCCESGLFFTLPFEFSKLTTAFVYILYVYDPPSFQWHLYPDYYFNLLTVLWTHLCCLNPALLHWQGLLENHTTKSPGAPILEKGYLFLFVFQWPEQLPDLWPVSSEQPVSFSQFLQLL